MIKKRRCKLLYFLIVLIWIVNFRIEIQLMQKAYFETQCLFIIQLLMELCDEEINPNENMEMIRNIALSYVNKLFLLMPELIDLLHSQGYPVKDIPMMIEHVEACHIVVVKIPELMRLPNLKKRIFFINFIAHVFKKFRLPVFAGYAQMMELYVKEQMEVLEPSEKIIFMLNILDALEMFAELLPFPKEEIIELIEKVVVIAKNRASLYLSLTEARKSPEKKFINNAKICIKKIKSLEKDL